MEKHPGAKDFNKWEDDQEVRGNTITQGKRVAE